MIATVLVIVLATIGGFMVPYLILEEKQTHTMEVLLVSPASVSQIGTGKALAGLFYCLAADRRPGKDFSALILWQRHADASAAGSGDRDGMGFADLCYCGLDRAPV